MGQKKWAKRQIGQKSNGPKEKTGPIEKQECTNAKYMKKKAQF